MTKRRAEKTEVTAEAPGAIIAYKGFNADWTCRGYQYEIGKTYKHTGKVEACESGFHACLDPLDVLNYYGYDGKFAEVVLSGKTATREGDTKIASAEITIKAELTIPQFVQRGIDYIFSKIDWDGAKEANTGYQSAATNTGNRSAATNTGDQSAATNTGDRSAATNTGNQSAASVGGKDSVALASGYQGRVSGASGCALFLVERGDNYEIVAAWAGIVGRDGVEPDVFYTLKNGKPVKAEPHS
jgi:hypothetical protein